MHCVHCFNSAQSIKGHSGSNILPAQPNSLRVNNVGPSNWSFGNIFKSLYSAKWQRKWQKQWQKCEAKILQHFSGLSLCQMRIPLECNLMSVSFAQQLLNPRWTKSAKNITWPCCKILCLTIRCFGVSKQVTQRFYWANIIPTWNLDVFFICFILVQQYKRQQKRRYLCWKAPCSKLISVVYNAI